MRKLEPYNLEVINFGIWIEIEIIMVGAIIDNQLIEYIVDAKRKDTNGITS